MAYTKQTWDTTSYVNPTRMKHIEDGIANAMTSENMSYLGAKNLNVYPYYESSHTDHNVVWTDNGDGTVTANGKATNANGDFNCHSHNATNEIYQLVLPNGKYIVSGCPSGGSTSTYYIQIGYYDNTGNFAVLGRDIGNGVEITLNGDYYSSDSVRLNITCRVYNGYTANNLVWKPMIRLAGDNDNTWTPYSKTNQELTREEYNVATANLVGAKNLLPYPYVETTHTDHDVVYTDLGDGTIKANGQASGGNAEFNCTLKAKNFRLKAGNYILSGCPSGGSTSTQNIWLGAFYDSAPNTLVSITRDYGEGSFFTLTEDAIININWNIVSGYNAQNLICKPMIRVASDLDNTWQPYAMTNKQITDVVGNPPTNAGTYTLQLVVDSSGNRTYSWV